MRVGLDAHAVFWRPTGAGTYLLGLLPELLKLLAADDEIVLLRSETRDQPKSLAWIRHARLRTVEAERASSLGRMWRFLPFPPMERVSGELDVCHSLRARLTPSQAPRRVVTFHNLHPSGSREGAEERPYPRAVRKSAHQADVIITPSRRTKEKLESRLQVAPEKIEVIPYGADWRFLQNPKAVEVEAFCSAYPFLQEPYLLAVGTAQRRKNFPFLIRAYALARRMEASLPSLVLLASPGEDSQPISAEIAAASLGGHTFLLEYLEPEFLQFLYRGAELFLHPASDEGFGLPLLEAAASGIPSLANSTCGVLEILPEGVCLPGDSVEAWAHEIVRLHGDEALRHESGGRAQREAEKWTWEEAARRHWQVYRFGTDGPAPTGDGMETRSGESEEAQ